MYRCYHSTRFGRDVPLNRVGVHLERERGERDDKKLKGITRTTTKNIRKVWEVEMEVEVEERKGEERKASFRKKKMMMAM